MTKDEFRKEAAKAQVNPNIYGLIINKRFTSQCEAGAKVVGIVWHDEWKRATRYNCFLGRDVDATHLAKAPYVVLKKGRHTYEIEAWRINGYLDEMFNKMIIDMIKKQNKKASE